MNGNPQQLCNEMNALKEYLLQQRGLGRPPSEVLLTKQYEMFLAKVNNLQSPIDVPSASAIAAAIDASLWTDAQKTQLQESTSLKLVHAPAAAGASTGYKAQYCSAIEHYFTAAFWEYMTRHSDDINVKSIYLTQFIVCKLWGIFPR